MEDKKNVRIASLIDHTLLRQDATKGQIHTLCNEAKQHGFYSVCINSHWVPECARELKNSQVKIVAVIGFPLGACLSSAKVREAELAARMGAQELDMVINLGELKDKNHLFVLQDIADVVKVGLPVKVILETHLLNEREKTMACMVAVEAGASFVKTSTGFTGGGATVDDIKLMRQCVGDQVGVKASGGVRTADQMISMIQAGANRIGTSSGVSIVQNLPAKGDY